MQTVHTYSTVGRKNVAVAAAISIVIADLQVCSLSFSTWFQLVRPTAFWVDSAASVAKTFL